MDSRHQELAARLGLGQSERIAQLLEMLADDRQTGMLLAMPGAVAALSEKTGLHASLLEEMLQDLFRKGLVFVSPKDGQPYWRMARDLVQFHDATLVWPEAPQEFIDLWRDFMEEEWPAIAKRMAVKSPRTFTRIIPVGVSLTARQQILAFEDVAQIIAKADTIAVTKCTCRLSMRKCDRPLETCLQVGRAAQYTIKRGSGRQLSHQEAMDILRQSEEAGLIHVTVNKQEVNNFICNCCPCCCQTMPVLIKHGTYVVDPSRYLAQVDAEACTGCGLCEQRCHFGAISYPGGEGGAPSIDAAKCMGCGLCLVTCPSQALSLSIARPQDFVPV